MLGNILRAVVTPGLLVHEWLHAVAGRLAGANVRSVEASGWGGVTTLAWPDDTPRWQIRVVHLAPTLTATAAALAAFVVLAVVNVDGWLTTMHGAFAAVYASVQFWLVAYPNESDRQPFADPS